MDYKYIEQLLERYWKCETSLEEEKILRTFFTQDNIPESLIKYKDLFNYQSSAKKEERLGDDFDEKILSLIDEPQPVKARRITISHRLMPLLKAAAVICVFLTIGDLVEHSLNFVNETTNNESANLAIAKDSASMESPSIAYDETAGAKQIADINKVLANKVDSSKTSK